MGMAKFPVDEIHIDSAEAFLAGQPQLAHVRVRKHGDLLVLESGPKVDAFRHARLRRVTAQWWTLEMPTHTGRWEAVPVRESLRNALTTLVDNFPWTLAPIA